MVNPMELAEKLGEAILKSEEYKNFDLSQEKMNNDDEAFKLVESFQDLQQSLRDAQMTGRKITQEQINELRTHQKQMMENGFIKDYLEAKRDLDGLMSSVQETISRVVGLAPAGGGSSCGGGCC